MEKTFIFFILLVLCVVQINTEVLKKCDSILQDFKGQLDILKLDFNTGDFDGVVAQSLLLSKIMDPVAEFCPVLLENKAQTSFNDTQCHSNIKNLINLYERDIVSNFQQIRDIINFQSEQCLPQDFVENGYSNIFPFTNNEEKSSSKLCAGCNIYMTILTNYVTVYQVKNITQFIEEKEPCQIIKTGLIRKACDKYFDQVGPILIESLKNNENSDQICQKVNACNGWSQCKLHGKSQQQQYFHQQLNQTSEVNETSETGKLDTIMSSALPAWIQKIINRLIDHKLPLYDIDDDRYSTYPYFRGTNWRGKDCSPYNKNIYPGRKTSAGKKGTDFNCNGIHGVNKTSGVPYKHQFCDNTGQKGVATIGDSGGAHFSLPPQYLNVSMWNNDTFVGFWDRLYDVFDLPQESAGTGWKQGMNGHSFYLKNVQKNRCNRNDFQNLGVNGSRSTNIMLSMEALARNVDKDFPLLVFWELIGNDVCSSNPFGSTKPEVFRQNIQTLWEKLDTLVPKGSHMVVTGIADGQILYECLQNREHPLGVEYPQFYEFLNCLDTSPCAGWMNTNATIRADTTKRANELNRIQEDIIKNTKFQNLEVQYYDLPLPQIMDTIKQRGGQCWDGIEPSDGFHPSGIAEKLWADILWENLERDHPDWLGNVNPHNEQISSMFGNESTYLGINIEDLEQEDILELQ